MEIAELKINARKALGYKFKNTLSFEIPFFFTTKNPKWLISGNNAIERSIKSIEKLKCLKTN